MEEKWCGYNTAMDAITELAAPSEKANRWMRTININNDVQLSDDEKAVFERLLPTWHRDFLQSKHIPRYALKTSLERLARNEEEARDLWNELGFLTIGGIPAALSILRLSMLVYPLIDLAVMRRQLCQSVVSEIKQGNLKPYFYPESLEGKGLSDREKLQAFVRLPLTEQVLAKIEINEFESGLGSAETFQGMACNLWRRYRDRNKDSNKLEQSGETVAKKRESTVAAELERVAAYEAVSKDPKNKKHSHSWRLTKAGELLTPNVTASSIQRALDSVRK